MKQYMSLMHFYKTCILVIPHYQLNINIRLNLGILIINLLQYFADNFFVDDYARFTALDSQGKTAAIVNSMNYLTKKGNTL